MLLLGFTFLFNIYNNDKKCPIFPRRFACTEDKNIKSPFKSFSL